MHVFALEAFWAKAARESRVTRRLLRTLIACLRPSQLHFHVMSGVDLLSGEHGWTGKGSPPLGTTMQMLV